MGINAIKPHTAAIADALSLFDEQFSIADLQEAIADEEKDKDSIMMAVRNAVKKAANQNGEEDGSRYVVDLDDGLKEAISSGDIKLDTNSAGEIFAQLRDEKGNFGKRLPIKEELIEQGVSVEAVELALQMYVIRDQLKEIISALSSIEGRVTEVLKGQQNDRLGLFYSGLSLYIEARSINDSDLRRQIIGQALKSLSDANSQMIQELRTSVEYLITEQYKQSKKLTDREDDFIAVYNSIKSTSVTVLTGSSGIGKTRLALEVCRKYRAEGIRVYCVQSNGLLLYEDIKYYLDEPGRYLVFLDDANMVRSQYIKQQIQRVEFVAMVDSNALSALELCAQ